MHREMTEQYFNHPSIIFWGMHNEIPENTPQGEEMTKIYHAFLKENGGNRLVVHASHQPLTDVSLKYSDVLCLNIYYGWYSGGLEMWEKFMVMFREHAKKLGIADRPIIYSEFGGAALYGFHDAEEPKWSEEYQATLITHALSVFDKTPEVAGSFIWQFTDIRTAAEMGFTRARGFNNKGLMNEYRRPKMAYHAVKAFYKSKEK